MVRWRRGVLKSVGHHYIFLILDKALDVANKLSTTLKFYTNIYIFRVKNFLNMVVMGL